MPPGASPRCAGRIARPVRASGEAYKGINVLMLWGEAVENGFACQVWMTYRQAQGLKGQVRKGEKGSLVVYADRIRRTETDEKGEATEGDTEAESMLERPYRAPWDAMRNALLRG